MAARNFHVFAMHPVALEAGLPRHHAVCLGVDGGHRHGKLAAVDVDSGQLGVGHVPVGEPLVTAGRVATNGLVAAEGTAQGHDVPDVLGQLMGEAAGEDAPQAPSHQADRGARGVGQPSQLSPHALQDFGSGPDIAAEAPAVSVVAERPEVVAQDDGGAVVGQESGQHEDGVTIALGCSAQQRDGGQEGPELDGGTGGLGVEERP